MPTALFKHEVRFENVLQIFHDAFTLLLLGTYFTLCSNGIFAEFKKIPDWGRYSTCMACAAHAFDECKCSVTA